LEAGEDDPPDDDEPSVGAAPPGEDPEPVEDDPDPDPGAADEDPLVGAAPPIAAAWNAANVLAELGSALTEKTMPLAQCTAGLVCAQKNHSGVVESETLKLNWGSCVFWPSGTFWKSESMPLLTQGAAKVDCVTEWFLLMNMNATVSPALAMMLEGVNVSVPFSPTLMRKFSARTERRGAKTAAARPAEKRIMSREKKGW